MTVNARAQIAELNEASKAHQIAALNNHIGWHQAEADKALLRQDIRDLGADQAQADARIKQLEQQLATKAVLADKSALLEHENEQLEQRIKQLESENGQLQSSTNQAIEQHDELKRERAKAAIEANTATAQAKRLTKELDAASKEIEKLRYEKSKTPAAKAKAANNDDKAKKLKAANAKIKSLETELKQSKTRIQSIRQELTGETRAVNELAKHYAAIKDDYSTLATLMRDIVVLLEQDYQFSTIDATAVKAQLTAASKLKLFDGTLLKDEIAKTKELELFKQMHVATKEVAKQRLAS